MDKKTANVLKVCAVVVTVAIVFGAGLVTAILSNGITIKIKNETQSVNSGVEPTGSTYAEPTNADETTELVTDESGEQITDANEEQPTVGGNVTPTSNTSNKNSVDLSSTQKILDYYTKAINGAAKPNSGFTVERKVKLVGPEPDIGDWKIPFDDRSPKDLLYYFVGIGEQNNYSNTFEKGYNDERYEQFQKCTLTANDIKKASYKQSGDNYIITLDIKDGSSHYKSDNDKSNNSPIEKCGMCAGEKDYKEFHHKNAYIIKNAGGALINSVNEKTTNCVAVATINAKTGRLSNLTINFDATVDIKIPVLGEKSMSASATVAYKDFNY